MKSSVKNTFFNVVSVLVSSLFGILVRVYLIRYLGEEILGVNATIVETINLLTVMEFGIESSIVYKLYRPINENDEERIRRLFLLIRKAYRIVGLVIFAAGLLVIPVIGKIVNSSVSIDTIVIAYCIQLTIVSCNYFFGYYKLILNAYQQMYKHVSFSIISSSLVSILQIVILIEFSDYYLYLLVSGISVVALFFFTRSQVRKRYSFLFVEDKIDRRDFREMVRDLKKLVFIQISGYVYGCTDNILLSSMFGAVLTGFVSNYKMVVAIIRSLLVSLYNGVNASWGAFLHSDKGVKDKFSYYMKFTFIEFISCMVLLVPTALLLDLLIVIFFGERFVIDPVIKYLIIIDIYGTFLHQPAGVFINNMGLFSDERRVSIITTIVNLGSSIVLALLIGPRGIFLGTVLAVIIYWIMRSYTVDRKCFNGVDGSYKAYWLAQLKYMISFTFVILACKGVMSLIQITNHIVGFIIYGIIIELIVVSFILLFYRKSEEFAFVKGILSGLKRKREDRLN